MGLVGKLIGNGKAKPGTGDGPTDLGDGALDTLAAVLRTLGDPALPLDDGLDADALKALFADLACHVENGAAVPAVNIAASGPGERRWGHIRRIVIERRQAECGHVGGRLADYRGVVEDLVSGLRELGRRDESTETVVGRNLKSIEVAVATGLLPEIRATLNRTVQNIADSFASQKREYERRIGELNRRMNSLRDDLVSAREEMKRDALTGAFNRGGFDTAIVHCLNLHFILKQPVTVVLLDLDNFKAVNDSFGHAAGDAVLKGVGECLSRTFIRKTDVVARYGGDEFAVLLPDTTAANCATLLDRFYARLAKLPVPNGGDDRRVGCSAGYTEVSAGDSVDALVERVDGALYAAKKAGRGCYRYAAPPAREGGLAAAL